MRSSLGADAGAARSRFAKRHGDWIGRDGETGERCGPERWGVQNTKKFCAFFCLIRRCDEALGRSTVAHFARKVRGANIVATKHELIIQQSHVPERWSCSRALVMFATCSSPSLCEQSELQCFAPIQFVPHTRLARRKHKMTFRKHFCPPKKRRRQRFRPLSPAQIIFYECLWPYVLDASTLQLMLPLL